MKRIFIFLLVLSLMLSSFGCQQDNNGSPSSSQTERPSPSDTSYVPEGTSEPTPEEAYLETVPYLHYELTGEAAPCYIGRWFEKEMDGVNHMVTLTDGATIYFLVRGATSFTIEYTLTTGTDIPYYAFSIDGSIPERKSMTDNVVTLPDNGYHTVRIIADGVTENVGKWGQENGFAFRGILPSEGGELFGIRPQNKVIFFYGDSITEGVCALGAGSSSHNNSATNAFPWFCSEALATVPYYIGYGGSGLISTGSFRHMLDAISYNSYKRPTIDTAKPDIIVINHGTNDVNLRESAVKNRLEKTITELREVYPDVPIVYVIPFLQYMSNVIRSVMSDVPNSYVIETSQWNLSTNDGVHPDTEGAKKAGNLLAEGFGKYLETSISRKHVPNITAHLSQTEDARWLF